MDTITDTIMLDNAFSFYTECKADLHGKNTDGISVVELFYKGAMIDDPNTPLRMVDKQALKTVVLMHYHQIRERLKLL